MNRSNLLRYLTVLGMTPCICLFGDTIFTSAASFESALSSFTTTGFNSISVPSGGFVSFFSGNPDTPLVINGITFITPTTPNAPVVDVNSSNFYSSSDYGGNQYAITGGAAINNEIDIFLPADTFAVGLDYGGFFGGNTGVITDVSSGASFTNGSLPELHTTDFVGFISSSAIGEVSFATTDDAFVVLDVVTGTPSAPAVPEPRSYAVLLGVAFLSFLILKRRRGLA